MYEYQAVRVTCVGRSPSGVGWDTSGAVPGLLGVNVDERITRLVNGYSDAGWETYNVSLGGTESNIHALILFRRDLA